MKPSPWSSSRKKREGGGAWSGPHGPPGSAPEVCPYPIKKPLSGKDTIPSFMPSEGNSGLFHTAINAHCPPPPFPYEALYYPCTGYMAPLLPCVRVHQHECSSWGGQTSSGTQQVKQWPSLRPCTTPVLR